MMISLIAAMGENRVIGIDDSLPWRLPADMKRFRTLTMGKPILMGRRTFESIGKALSGRKNIVLTGRPEYEAQGCTVVRSIDEGLSACDKAEEAFVIGGESLYRQMLERADRMYLTLVHKVFAGDTFFPWFDPREWRESECVDCRPDADNPYPYSFLLLERV